MLALGFRVFFKSFLIDLEFQELGLYAILMRSLTFKFVYDFKLSNKFQIACILLHND